MTDLVKIARDVAEREGFVVDPPNAPHFDETSIDVVDMRQLLWSSIDNYESRDLDQIEAAERIDGNRIRVYVGIADVSAHVPMGSELDKHAGWNTTSLYAGVATFPMLPISLSEGATSLLEGGERIAVVTELVVEEDGKVSHCEIHRAKVRNHAKLVYDEVGPWLEGGKPPALIAHSPSLAEQVRLQDEAAQRLRKRRIEHGALQLETIEARAVPRGNDVVALKLSTKNRAKELIEDLMIAVNGATAQYLESRRYASIRRVVRVPKRWDRIVDVAATHGTKLPAEPDAVALSEFLQKQHREHPDTFADISLAVVKLMGAGEYLVADPESPEGHFGLAVDAYSHSTAPNRRYGDLVTQRLLLAAAAKQKAPYDVPALKSIAVRCTDMEDHARKFERTMRKVAAATFLSHRIGDTFDSIVTGAGPKGVFVRLIEPPAEGRIVKDGEGLDVGDHVKVKLVATEPSRGFIDFVRSR